MNLINEAPSPTEQNTRVREAFARAYGAEPAGVWSAPGRVNIIGEHVDYQAGLCVPMAISHRCFVAAAPRSDFVVRIRSLQAEGEAVFSVSELEPGSVTGWAAYVAGVVWALRGHGGGAGERPGLDIMVDGAVPLGAGLSSSAALECASAAALEDLWHLNTHPAERIRACITAETRFVGAPTGGLDQSASILGQRGHALVLDCSDFSTRAVRWDLEAEGLALLIVDTRATHALVGGEYAERREQTERAARLLGVETLREVPAEGAKERLAALAPGGPAGEESDVVLRRARHVVSEIERVREFVAALDSGSVRENVEELGTLMNASHDSLRDDFEVTVPQLDVAVDAARAAGAHGARMTGGGFGGSIIALVDAADAEPVARAVAEAFAARGWVEPSAFLAAPGGGAGRYEA